MLVTHPKSITIADGTNTNIVRPSDWNSAHAAAVTLVGNTSNQSTWQGSNLHISGGSNITVGISNNSMMIHGAPGGGGGGAVSLYGFAPFGYGDEHIAGQIGQSSIFFIPTALPYNAVVDRAWIPVIVSLNTGSTATVTLSINLALYSSTNNNTQITLLSTFSGSITLNLFGTASSASYSGLRYFTFDLGGTNTISAGNYVLGFLSRTSSSSANATISNLIVSNMNTSLAGYLGLETNTSYQFRLFLGSYSAQSTNFPASVGASQIRGTAAVALRPPIFRFEYGTA